MAQKTDHKPFQIVNAESGGEILISGYISSWTKANSRDFRNAFNKLAKGGKVTVRISNSGGGDMIEGFTMADMMRNSQAEVTTIVEGLAASMASVIFVAGDVRKISESAMVMTHRPIGYASGSSEQMRSYADLMDKLEKNVKSLFVAQTGQDEKEVNKLFLVGKDVWLDCDDCIDKSIATEKIEAGSVLPDEVMNALKQDDKKEKEVFKILNSTTKRVNNTDHMNELKVFLASLGAIIGLNSEEATEENVTNKVKELNKNSTEMSAKIKSIEDAAAAERSKVANALTDKAVELGIVPEHLKGLQVEAFNKDFDGAKAALESQIKAKAGDEDGKSTNLPESVVNFLDGVKSDGKSAPQLKKYEEYTEAELKELQEKNPEAFSKLVENYTGVEK